MSHYHHQQQQQTSSSKPRSDWSATQYLKFSNERTRPVHDLVANIPLHAPKRIIDLGCGPGNSTAVLAARWPDAHLSGMDASPAMLARARQRADLPPGVTFTQGDLHTFQPPEADGGGVDLLFSNAVFHWLRREQRIPTVLRLLRTQSAGGVLALQVPDNYEEPSHRTMREVARGCTGAGPWTACFEAARGAGRRPELDPVETPAEWYDALSPLCARVEVWHVLYQHVMEGPGAIVEWVKGSGLMPFLDALPSQEVKDAFLAAYEERLGEVYERRADGKVLLRYPRLFVVATRK